AAIGDEHHLRAVPGEQERARTRQPLHEFYRRIRRPTELVLRRAIRPDDARHDHLFPSPQAHVRHGAIDDLLDDERAGADLQFAADAEGIDVLVVLALGMAAQAEEVVVVAFGALHDETLRRRLLL